MHFIMASLNATTLTYKHTLCKESGQVTMVKVNQKIHYSHHIALLAFVLIMNQRLFHTFTFFQLNPIGLFLVNLSAPLIGLAGYVVNV